MPFGGFEHDRGRSLPMSEINVTPLVDVMLVLLVIFIITAPLLSYAIRLDLPNDVAPPADATPTTVKISVEADGQVYWNSEKIDDGELKKRFGEAGATSAQPEVHLRADKATRYERIAFVMATAQQAGLTKLGFITEPAPTSKP